MGRIWLLLSFISFIGCQAPISYINNLPQISGLQEKNDFMVRANWGADAIFENQIYDFDLAFAPAKKFGVKTHLTFGSQRTYYERLSYADFALVYFDKLADGLRYEIVSGFGGGSLRASSTNFADPEGHHCGCVGLPVGSLGPDFTSLAKSANIFFQPSLNIPLNLSDARPILSLGLRGQVVYFDKYYYEQDYRIIYNKPFTTILLDPFLSFDQQVGRFGAQVMAGYSLNLREKSSQPVYSSFYTSFGVFLRVSK